MIAELQKAYHRAGTKKIATDGTLQKHGDDRGTQIAIPLWTQSARMGVQFSDGTIPTR
jgi:hypothetical protein